MFDVSKSKQSRKLTPPEKSQISKEFDNLLKESVLLGRPVNLREATEMLSDATYNKISSTIDTDDKLDRFLKVILIKKCISLAPNVDDFDKTIELLGKIGEAIPLLFTDPNSSFKNEAIKYLREIFEHGIKDSNNVLKQANSVLAKKKLPFISGLQCLIGDPENFLHVVLRKIERRNQIEKTEIARQAFINNILSAAMDTRVGTFEKSLQDITLTRAFPNLTPNEYDKVKQKIALFFGTWENAVEAAEKTYKASQSRAKLAE